MLSILCALIAAGQPDLVGGEVKRLATDMKFTEGPVADGKGNLYFSDIPANRIMKWDGKELSTFRENSGGANGLKLDKEGNLYVCEGGGRRIVKISPAGGVTVLADAYEGKKLNSPNDLCFDARGGLYFTDPRYGKRDDMELDKEAVYYIPPGGGKARQVVDDLVRPNGLHVDGDRLYVADTGAKKTYVYAMNPDGSLKDKREFAPCGSDGLKVDEKGNVYLTSGGVRIYDRQGKHLGTLEVPEGPSNLAFDGKTLYITARTSLYMVAMKVAGN
jgi:gluconolactonase